MSTKLTLKHSLSLSIAAQNSPARCSWKRWQLLVPPTVGQVVPDAAMPKAAESVPVNVICESVSAALPTFRSVIACGPLVVPIASVPNVREDGERLAIWCSRNTCAREGNRLLCARESARIVDYIDFGLIGSEALRSENDIDATRASGQDRIGTASGGLHCKLSFVGSGGSEVRYLERLIALVEDGDDLRRTDRALRLISKCNAGRGRHCKWPAAKSKDGENLWASRRVIGNGDEGFCGADCGGRKTQLKRASATRRQRRSDTGIRADERKGRTGWAGEGDVRYVERRVAGVNQRGEKRRDVLRAHRLSAEIYVETRKGKTWRGSGAFLKCQNESIRGCRQFLAA